MVPRSASRSLSTLVLCFSASCSQSRGHLAIEVCLCHWAALQQERAPSAVPPRRSLQFPVIDRNKLVKPLLACPFPLCQFLEPGQVLTCVFNTARNPVADELK